MSLKNKKVLITAGPTWVPIDSVRVISNVATGQTGILLAQKLSEAGAKVTLLLGPVGACCLDRKIKVLPFRFFDELRDNFRKELAHKKYDVVIHSAAVSDYRPRRVYPLKIRSGIKRYTLELVPTKKIIDAVKGGGRSLLVVGFKFEPRASKEILLQEARALLHRIPLNMVVANTRVKGMYRAYIIRQSDEFGPFYDRDAVGRELIQLIGEGEWKN